MQRDWLQQKYYANDAPRGYKFAKFCNISILSYYSTAVFYFILHEGIILANDRQLTNLQHN